MDGSASAQRQAFSHWLRTGRLPRPSAAEGRELKFNPYHDPDNGRFTFAPGGPRSLASVVVSDKRRPKNSAPDGDRDQSPAAPEAPPRPIEAVYHPDENNPLLRQVAAPRGGPPMRRGGNYEALIRPMTLEQVFPSLRNTPGGAIVAVVDNLLDFSGPSLALTGELTNELTNVLEKQIQAIDPDYRYISSGVPQTLEGQVNQLNDLRFDLAVALFRKKGDARALQVETLRFMQQRADEAYDRGSELLKAGRLPIRLSKEEALGNYIDREVREALRGRFNKYGIETDDVGPIRVNRREYVTSESELVFSRPDVRVADVALDVTLSPKDSRTPQVGKFFRADFRPKQVVIIRPRQLGPNSTYAIQSPETRK